jgi:hypothetical protein
VEQCAGKMNARLSRHAPSLAWKATKTNNQSLTLSSTFILQSELQGSFDCAGLNGVREYKFFR